MEQRRAQEEKLNRERVQRPESSEVERAGSEFPAAAVQCARTAPQRLTAGHVAQLPRTVGNRAVQRILPHRVQAKLEVSPPGDPYEREADRVADRVMRSIEAPEAEREGSAPGIQRTAAGAPAAVTGELEQEIQTERGRGSLLAEEVRQPLESAFGADFSQVRLHTGDRADRLNRSVSARAFTTGQDIFFRKGEYAPGSGEGRRLLAHELTHVVQQNGKGHKVQRAVIPVSATDTIDTQALTGMQLLEILNGLPNSRTMKTLEQQNSLEGIVNLARTWQPGEERTASTTRPSGPPPTRFWSTGTRSNRWRRRSSVRKRRVRGYCGRQIWH